MEFLPDDLLFVLFKKIGLRDVLAIGSGLSKRFQTFIENNIAINYTVLSGEYHNVSTDGNSVYALMRSGNTMLFYNLTTMKAEFSLDPRGLLGIFLFRHFAVLSKRDEIKIVNLKTQKKTSYSVLSLLTSEFLLGIGTVFFWDPLDEELILYTHSRVQAQIIIVRFKVDSQASLTLLRKMFVTFPFATILKDNRIVGPKILPLNATVLDLYYRVTRSEATDYKLVRFNLPASRHFNIPIDDNAIPIFAQTYESYVLVINYKRLVGFQYIYYDRSWNLISSHIFRNLPLEVKEEHMPNWEVIATSQVKLFSDKKGDFFFVFRAPPTKPGHLFDLKIVKQTLVRKFGKTEKSNALKRFKQLPKTSQARKGREFLKALVNQHETFDVFDS